MSAELGVEYTIRDHLGNSRVNFSDLNQNGRIEFYGDRKEVIQENHYYPFGLNMEGEWASQIGPNNKYQYNGKELNDDFGLGWNDYGARFYDAAIGRWNAVDPLAESYIDITNYAYVANNPILLIDPDGAQIDVSRLLQGKGGVATLANLLFDLSHQTGLNLSVNVENGVATLDYAKGNDGKELIETSNGQELGSSTARGLIKNTIDNPEILFVNNSILGSSGEQGGNQLNLDGGQIEGSVQNTSKGLTSKTAGYGMTFIHELYHTKFGGDKTDKTSKSNPRGDVVDAVNVIRNELDENPLNSLINGGRQYGQRETYIGTTGMTTSYEKQPRYNKQWSTLNFSYKNTKGRYRTGSVEKYKLKRK